MEKALWNGKEILAFEVSAEGNFDLEETIRKASGRKELLCPDENCSHRILRYCHGEKKRAYFAHIDNTDCEYEKYDKQTTEVIRTIKSIIYHTLKGKGYDVDMDVKLIPHHYSHLVIYKNGKPHAIQIISKFSSANRIADFYAKYKAQNIPVDWIVTGFNEDDEDVVEHELNYAKRFSLNRTEDNSLLAVSLDGTQICLYKMDTNEYLFDGCVVPTNNYKKIYSENHPLTSLVFKDGKLTVNDFDENYNAYIGKKKKAFEKKIVDLEKEKEQRKQEQIDRQKRIEEVREQRRQVEEAERREREIRREKIEAERLARLKAEKEAQEQWDKEQAEKKENERKRLQPLTQGFEIGDRVQHISFGLGTVTDIVGNLITIKYDRGKIKKSALNYMLNNNQLKKLE